MKVARACVSNGKTAFFTRKTAEIPRAGGLFLTGSAWVQGTHGHRVGRYALY